MLAHLIILLPLFGVSPSKAELPPRDYREELAQGAARAAEDLNARGLYSQAIEQAQGFEDRLFPASSVEYEIAYAYNRQDKTSRALTHYQRAVELDPTNAAAWYDAGELLLRQGELDRARESFQQAALLQPTHWAGPFRLADVAARQRDPVAFELHFKETLRRGFDLRTILQNENWRGYYRDPLLGPVIKRVVTVYLHEDLLRLFEVEP